MCESWKRFALCGRILFPLATQCLTGIQSFFSPPFKPQDLKAPRPTLAPVSILMGGASMVSTSLASVVFRNPISTWHFSGDCHWLREGNETYIGPVGLRERSFILWLEERFPCSLAECEHRACCPRRCWWPSCQHK